jgi:CheY-like chemotaxis protein
MDSDRDANVKSLVIKCSSCGRAYRVHPERLPAGVSSIPCRACGSLLPLTSPDHGKGIPASAGGEAHTVLVAVNEEGLASLIRRILENSGYHVIITYNGESTLQAVREDTVDLILVNVFLSDMMGFELLDRIRDEEGKEGLPAILLSSVHHGARYKRAPTSLYGADDYIERHHLPDLLIPKIRRLLETCEGEERRGRPSPAPSLSDEQVLQRRELEEIENRPPGKEEAAGEEMVRMCRVIAGDIALYNEDVIQSTDPGQLISALSEDLREGEALLQKRFQSSSGTAGDVLREEIELLLRSRGIVIP